MVEQSEDLLFSLYSEGIEFIVVGGTAAVLLGVPVTTLDIDILHRRTPENVARLMKWLGRQHAYHRMDLANRRLPPKEDQLMGHGHLNLQTDLGRLDILCELALGEGYDEVLQDTVWIEQPSYGVRVLGLSRLIRVKAATGRPKDRVMLPLLIAVLEERRKQGEPE